MGVLLQEKAVNTVMAGRFAGRDMNAAAGNNQHISPLADIEVIIDNIIDIAMGDTGRDRNPLAFSAGENPDHQARRIRLVFNLDIIRRLASDTAAVLTDIIGILIIITTIILSLIHI